MRSWPVRLDWLLTPKEEGTWQALGHQAVLPGCLQLAVVGVYTAGGGRSTPRLAGTFLVGFSFLKGT